MIVGEVGDFEAKLSLFRLYFSVGSSVSLGIFLFFLFFLFLCSSEDLVGFDESSLFSCALRSSLVSVVVCESVMVSRGLVVW